MDQEVRDRLLFSILEQNLVILVGAGLSMGPPTELLSARDLALEVSRRYQTRLGQSFPEDIADDNLEQVARFFWEQEQFAVPFIRYLVPWEADFQNRPNEGHVAIADLLLCRGLDSVVSTNYDTHIEDAAGALGEGNFDSALSGPQANTLPNRYQPLLKLHGCFRKAKEATVWLPEQREVSPAKERLAQSEDWLRGRLQGRDLLVVGFWSDWNYLNEIFADTVTGVTPQSVVLVDPGASEELDQKAPNLWEWATDGGPWFRHVRRAGEEFLEELRREVSVAFVRMTLDSARERYAELTGRESAVTLPNCEEGTAEDLYTLRRDITGCGPTQPVASLDPGPHRYPGAVALGLLENGATIEGPAFLLGRGYRVVSASGRLVSELKAEYGGDEVPQGTTFIAVGAVADDSAPSIVRGGEEASIARVSSPGLWVTQDQTDVWQEVDDERT